MVKNDLKALQDLTQKKSQYIYIQKSYTKSTKFADFPSFSVDRGQFSLLEHLPSPRVCHQLQHLRSLQDFRQGQVPRRSRGPRHVGGHSKRGSRQVAEHAQQVRPPHVRRSQEIPVLLLVSGLILSHFTPSGQWGQAMV
jgi:hypothetical protein